MTEPTKAVFLSYASQDAEAAKRIADALRAAGVEVWFDQSELRGGDAWDAMIRKRIKECALFVPVITPNTNARAEGYFRLEWKLAVDRSHLMADDAPFLFPVVIGDVNDATARVPDKFRDVQWTRLRLDETAAELGGRVARLLSGSMEAGRPRPAERGEGTASPGKAKPAWLGYAWAGIGIIFALVYALRPMWQSARRSEPKPVAVAPVAVPISEARELVAKARRLFFQLDETKDDLKLAEELLKQAIAKDRSDAEVWAAYAQLHQWFRVRGWDLSDERREQAREATQLALRLDPQSFEVRFAQAAGLIIGGVREMAEKEAALHALLRERPSDQRVLRALGTLLRNMPERHEEANRIYEQSAALPGGDPLALYDKAMNLWFDGRASEAERALGAAIAQRSFAGARLMELFFALSLRGDRDRAYALLQGISQSEMEDARACIFAYLVHRYRDEPDLALAAIRASPRDWLDDFRYRGPRDLLAGDALVQAGRPDAAAVEWRAALKVTEARLATSPNDLTALGSRLTLLALLGDTAEARKLLPTVRQMVRADQSGVLVPVWFSRVYLALGERTEAMRQIAVLLSSRLHAVYLTAADLRFDPIWAPLRGDLEFARLIAEANRVEQADDATAPIPRSTAAAPMADNKSVAVLAFANLSDDKANEYFSDGISEELLNVLAKVPKLKVSARTSAFYFKGKQVPMAEIAKQLGVAYVVEGSVRKAGDKVRITAQLIKAADGFHVWSDTFTRDLKDIFAVQDEIAGLIAKNLSLKMGMTAARPTIDVEAYQEYLTGKALFAKASNDDLRAAVGHFEKALEIEPKFTAAWVQLASAHTRLGRWGGTPSLQAWAAARAAIDKARTLEPESPEVLLALGWILRTGEWNWWEAEQAFRRALQLRPNHPETLAGAAVLLFNIGKTEEAYRLAQQAVQFDPLNASTQIDLSIMFYMNKNWVEAERSARRALQLAPSGTSYRSILSWGLIGQRRFAEAEAEIARDQDGIDRTNAQGLLAIARGQEKEARDQLARLEGYSRVDGDLADLQQSIAWLCAYLGEKDRAFAALEKAAASRDPSMAWLINSWYLEPLHSDPRWSALLRKVGLADDQLK